MWHFVSSDHRDVHLAPDATSYWLMSTGEPVSRPYHLRWLLPAVCRQDLQAWWIVWIGSWFIVAAGFALWRDQAGDPWYVVAAGVALLLGLPGVLGPQEVIPVGVDLPAMGMNLVGVGCLEAGLWPVALVFFVIAATIKETSPVWAVLWSWSPIPLVAAVAPIIRALIVKPAEVSPLGPQFNAYTRHPIATALKFHAGRWRDAWAMVAPWGVCLVALIDIDWRLLIIVAVAYAQLLVATDTVRLYQMAAGPAVAAAAANTVPAEWLLAAVVVHVVWWRRPERG